jgi:hypothetical protein
MSVSHISIPPVFVIHVTECQAGEWVNRTSNKNVIKMTIYSNRGDCVPETYNAWLTLWETGEWSGTHQCLTTLAVKRSDDGTLHSELLSYCSDFIVWYSERTQRFGYWICSRPQMNCRHLLSWVRQRKLISFAFRVVCSPTKHRRTSDMWVVRFSVWWVLRLSFSRTWRRVVR